MNLRFHAAKAPALAAALALLGTGACSLAPKYVRPTVETPAA